MQNDKPMKIDIRRTHPNAVIPKYQTPGSASFDIHLIEDIHIPARSIKKVRTGLVIGTPDNFVLVLASRSSNPLKKGIDMANSIGVIDSDYRGNDDEIFLQLMNVTGKGVDLATGDRVAQGMFLPVHQAEFTEVDAMPSENRGGWGSTGR